MLARKKGKFDTVLQNVIQFYKKCLFDDKAFCSVL